MKGAIYVVTGGALTHATRVGCTRRVNYRVGWPRSQSLPGRETSEAVLFQGGEAEIVAIEP